MKLSKLSYAVAVASLLAVGAAAHAEVKSSGSVAFTTDYKFRGISQSNTNAAVQGAMTLTHDSGVYVSAWASSIANASGGLELDTLLGYAGSEGDISYDVGVMRYNYPGNDGAVGKLSYNEVYASASAYGAKVGANYSDDYFAESGKFSYVYASYAKEVYEGFGVVASIGLNSFDDAASYAKATGFAPTEDKYIDYKVGVTKTVEGFAFELSYVDTDVKDADDGNGNLAQGSAVLTVSKAF